MVNIEETPLGWEVDLLYLMAHCCTKLCLDIDMQLKKSSGGTVFFEKKKMKLVKEQEQCLKNARVWLQKAQEQMDKFGLDEATFDAVDNNSRRYTNVLASANELIRAAMLVIDRGHCQNGDAKVFKRLRSLPANGIFPDEFIERFQMKYEIVPEAGDRVSHPTYGEGVLDFNTIGKNWNVKFDSGVEKILNENQFNLL